MRGLGIVLALWSLTACSGSDGPEGDHAVDGASGSGSDAGGMGVLAGAGGVIAAAGASRGGAPPGGGAGSEQGGSVAAGGGVVAGGTGGSSGGVGGGGAGALPTGVREVAAPPTYLGSVDNGPACATPYGAVGFEPEGDSQIVHPLFLYFVGTRFVPTDASAVHDSAAALAVTEVMARRGFVALSIEYDNSVAAWLDPTQENQLRCLFDPSQGDNMLALACALPGVDCDLGIATWGHSQGAFVAHVAHDYDARVRAVWTTGYGGNASASLSPSRLRVVNGQADFGANSTADGLNAAAGYGTAGCAAGATECLRPDGSGWILVQSADLSTPGATADHCWFDRSSCADTNIVLDSSWVDPVSDKPFALSKNADWVAVTVALP